MVSVLFLLVFLSCSQATSVFGPPKLLSQPPEEVWFQPGAEEAAARFSLKCIASDNAETYYWKKNGEVLEVEGEISWEKPGQSGSILFTKPGPHHIGYYQCFSANIYGTAVSNRVHVQLGVLEHFASSPLRRVEVSEGESLSLQCSPPFGQPSPTVFWLYRDSKQDSVIETIQREHITLDPEGGLHFTSVTAHDGRPTLVYECAASSPVLHGEYRMGDRVQITVKPSRTGAAVPRPPKPLYLSPSDVTVKAGSRIKLQCIFGGFPSPKIFWSRESAELPKERIKQLTGPEADFGRSLVIENVHPEDEGTYVCRAGKHNHKMTLHVEAAPYWEHLAPDDVEVPEGEMAELRCLAGGRPAPLVQWTQNGKPLHEATSSSRYLLLDGGRRLRITRLDHDLDTAVYQCNASNPRGYVYANAFVHVKAYPPRFLMPSNRVWKVVLMSTVDMNCDVDSAPSAHVRWVDQDDKNIVTVPGKSEILRNNSFRIYQVNTADEGLYYCNVSNKYGINRATNKLHVYKSTYFTKVPSPKRLTVERGQRVELECEAVPDERLEIHYNWTVNGQPIREGDTAYEISGTKLTLPAARGWHSGRIECTANTDIDVKISSMHLLVKDVPRWPPIEAMTCSERKATIEWNKPDDHSDPITHYLVEMHTDFKKNEWVVIVEERDVSKQSYSEDVTLTPWVNYTFRVAALNSHGRSLEESVPLGAKQTAACHTRPSFPYTNPSGVWAEGTAPDNIVVHWNAMDKHEWNAPRLQYLVRYRLKAPDVAWSEFVVEDSFANETIIREVPTFRKYEVQVRAVNSIGPSIVEPETIIGYSGEDVPTAVPTEFAVSRVLNFTSAAFTWTPVREEDLRGHAAGYEIEFWPTGYREKARVTFIPGAVSVFVLHSLHSCTNYTAVLRARNNNYRSDDSLPVSFDTPEGIPSEVTRLEVVSVGARALLVTWAPPAHPNGMLRGYFLVFTNERNETDETYVLHRQTHYLFEKATPDTGYKLSVWAETGAGEGPREMRTVRTWTHRAPDEPRFEVVNATDAWAEVEWKPSEGSLWRMPGSAFYVNYTADGVVFWQSQPVFLPNRRVALFDLLPSTKYTLYGVARDGQLWSQTKEGREVHTASDHKPSHLNQESVRNAFWFLAVLVTVAVALIAVLITCCCEQRRSGRYAVRRKEMEIGHQVDADEERTFLEYQFGYKP